MLGRVDGRCPVHENTGASDNKTVERFSGRGKDTRNWEMKYDYKAQAAVAEAPEKNGSSVAKAAAGYRAEGKSWARYFAVRGTDKR